MGIGYWKMGFGTRAPVTDASKWRMGGAKKPCIIFFFLIPFLLIGCEEDVTSVLGTDRVYSLYGVLSPQLDRQTVRVFPIESILQPAPNAPLDARFTSLDVQTGEVRVWQDSLIQEPNGQYAHVFASPFRAAYEHTYQIEVERSDGAASRVTVTVPPRAELVVEAPRATFPIIAPVRVNKAVPRLIEVEVTYVVRFQLLSVGALEEGTLVLRYTNRVEQEPDGWIVPIDLWTDFRTIKDRLEQQGPLDDRVGIRVRHVSLDLIVASEAWNPPGGVFDSDALVEAGTLSNVERGFGLVGAGYTLAQQWVPPDSVLLAAGFRGSP